MPAPVKEGGHRKRGRQITTVALTDAQRDWLEKEASEHGEPISRVIRKSLGLYQTMPDAVRGAVADPLGKGVATPQGGVDGEGGAVADVRGPPASRKSA